MKKVTIVLPWPDSNLMPNRRNGKHWRSYDRAKKASREAGKIAAYDAGAGKLKQGLFSVRYVFYAPDRRRRDLDGLYGALKHTQDSVCEVLGIDDSQLNPVTLVRRLDQNKRGYVVMTLEAI